MRRQARVPMQHRHDTDGSTEGAVRRELIAGICFATAQLTPGGIPMLKYTRRLGAPFALVTVALLGACRSDAKKADSTALGADTSLNRDLALANRDTAAQPQLKDVPANAPAPRRQPSTPRAPLDASDSQAERSGAQAACADDHAERQHGDDESGRALESGRNGRRRCWNDRRRHDADAPTRRRRSARTRTRSAIT